MLTGLAATTIFSEDHTELLPFYRDTLRLPIADEGEGETIFGAIGGGALFLVATHSEVKGPAKEPMRQIPALLSTDVRADYERLKAAGVAFASAPEESGPVTVATLSNPEGNLVSILQFN